MNSEKLLEEIKSRIDIVDFISDYVPLKKSGQNFKGLCPFHSEKTPSFMVSQPKQIFHCFGCNAGGDMVSFLMKHENLSFGEALRYIAKKAGIKIEEFGHDKDFSVKREKILQVNDEAVKFFTKNLNVSKGPKDYLKKRGVSEESLINFSVGYAADQWDALFVHFKKAGYADSLILNARLVIADGKGSRDFFRKRIIFPISNLKNDVIAFGGRVMDNSLPKYLNSPETDVFKKSETLFAINLAREEIRKREHAIIVEGYLDAIICHQYGFKNTIAPLGTALTSRQLQKLKILTDKVVLVFDSDAAGIAAARRSLAILCESGFKAKILLLPEGEDPDSFLRKNGGPAFQKMLGEALSMIEFLLKTARGERTDQVREVLGMVANVRDILRTEEMLGELADRSRMNESALRRELERIKKKPGLQADQGAKSIIIPSPRQELLLLSTVISFPEKAETVLSRLNIEDISDETIRSLFQKIRAFGDDVSVGSLLENADPAERALITKLSVDPGFDPELADQNIDDCLQTMAYKSYEERKRHAEAKEPDDLALHNSLLEEKRKFSKGANP
jgi:DNA primase